MERLVGVPVLVENDATAAVIGERLYGVARGLSSFVYLFLGGGIGAGMFLDGHLYRGSRANAGEIDLTKVAKTFNIDASTDMAFRVVGRQAQPMIQ